MAKHITRLTATQQSAMAAHRDKWIRLGLSTEPYTEDDRREVEQALRFCYRRAGLVEPKAVIVAPSPFTLRVASGIAVGALHARHNGWPTDTTLDAAVVAALRSGLARLPREAVDTAVRAAVDDAIDEPVSQEIDATVVKAVDAALSAASFGIAVHHAVRSALDIGVDAAVGTAAGSAVRTAVALAIGAPLDRETADGTQTGTQVGTRGRFLLRCAHDAEGPYTHVKIWPGRTAGRTYLRDCCDLEIADADALAALEAIDSRTSAISLHPEFAMLTERPSLMRRDATGRLHAADGPAIAYRDGWRLYLWHGRLLPRSHEWLITERARLTPDAIEDEPKPELRCVALEIFGFERYLAVRPARVIATNELHGEQRRLLEIMMRGAPVRIIEVVTGSTEPDGGRYLLAAMPGDTPHEVIAASYRMAPARSRAAVRM